MHWLLHHQLSSANASARRDAAEQLCRDPRSGSISALGRALAKDQDVEVRRLAAMALGKIEDDRCIEPLLAALRDNSPEVKKAAVLALKRVVDERVPPALALLLRDADAGVRGHAAQSLELRGWHAPNREDEIWLLVARGNCSRAASFGAAAFPALQLVLQSSPFSLCVAAVQALTEINDPRVVRVLLNATRSSDPTVVIAAVDALGRIGDPQAIDTITPLLSNRNGRLRLAAVDALGGLGAASAVQPLCGLLTDPLWDVRRAVAETLGRLKDRLATSFLVQALGDQDDDVREATAMALGNIGDRDAIGPLIMTLKDPASGVRRIAAAALSRIDPEWSSSDESRSAIEDLKVALPDADPGARYFIEQLLVGLGAVSPLTGAPQQSSDTSVSSPAKRRKLAVSLFLAILCDPDRDLRHAAANALAHLGDERARQGLVRAVADADPFVSAAAEDALQVIGEKSP